MLEYDQCGAGDEVERGLAPGDVEHVRLGVHAAGPRPAADGGDAAPVPQATRVIEHVADRERRSVVGQFGDVLTNLIVERQLAVAREQHHRRGGELLGDGSGFEDRLRRNRHVVLEVGHPVAPGEHRSAVGRDADGATRRGRGPPGEHRVDLGGRIGRRRGGERTRTSNGEPHEASHGRHSTRTNRKGGDLSTTAPFLKLQTSDCRFQIAHFTLHTSNFLDPGCRRLCLRREDFLERGHEAAPSRRRCRSRRAGAGSSAGTAGRPGPSWS